MTMAMSGAKAALWCPACLRVTVTKVLSMTPGLTKITWARCDDCGLEFEPGLVHVPDLGEHHDHDLDHTPGEITESDGLPSGP